MINKIIVYETDYQHRIVVFPILPEKIEFKSNGARFMSYDIIDLGEVMIPSGENLRGFRWTSIFPGKNHDLPFKSVSGPMDPEQYQIILSEWLRYGIPLHLMILGTPINHHVYLKDYDVDYSGPFGDYEYTIEFIDRREIQVTTEANTGSESKPQTERITEQTKTYTVTENDTLWDISRRFLQDGMRWQEIYELNKDAIEETAVQRGLRSSDNGHWIFAGTVLHIPN